MTKTPSTAADGLQADIQSVRETRTYHGEHLMLDPCNVITPDVNKVFQLMYIKLVILNKLASLLIYLKF